MYVQTPKKFEKHQLEAQRLEQNQIWQHFGGNT